MDSNINNEQELLFRRQQQEQERQRLLQQQQHQPGFNLPPSLRQHHQYPYGPSPVASSASTDPHSEHLMSSSRSGALNEQHHHQQHPAGLLRGGRVAQGSAGDMNGNGSAPTIAQERENGGLALHRQQFRRLQQEQQNQQQHSRTFTPTTVAPRPPSAHPFHGQTPSIPFWQYQQEPQQMRYMLQQQQQHQTPQPGQRSPTNTPFLASAQSTSTSRLRSSPRMSTPISSRASGPFLLSSRYPRGGSSFGYGRVSPYPPPMLSTRAQESQHFQWAGNVINVDPLSNLNPGPSLRRQDQQSQNQSQRDLPSTPRRTSQLLAEEASRRPLIAPPARQTHSTASVHDFGDGGFGGDNNGDGAYHSCSHEPHPVETVLPAQAPISIHGHRNNGSGIGDDAGAGGDLEMDYVLEEEEPGPPPIEVTLNIDIPKSSRPPTEGVPSTTVLNVNPSWHVVFVETIQQQRIRTSVRIQFCPNSSTSRLVEHRAKVRRLQTVQVIGYASCRVELSRRIRGQTLLNRGGLVLHLDPKSITFNEASYGFTLSLSSFEIGQLSQTHNSRPDIPIPLARQQNSAYCRRNLKEMYYDTITKDVAITLRPSGEVFYAHSVVLESHAYFRALIEQQYKSQSPLEGQGREDTSGMTVETEAVVDEEGYAQPLRPQLQQQRSSSYPTRGADGLYDSGGGLGQTDQVHSRTKIMIDVNDTSPTVFRAVLHYMYMGHVPITSVFQQPQQPGNPFASGGSAPGEAQDASGPSISTDTHAGNEPSSSSSGITGLEALTVAASIAATESSSTGGPSIVPPPLPQAATAPTAASVTPGAATTSSGVLTGTIDPAAPAAPQLVTATMQLRDFPWRELYEIATRYQLSGLVHLTKVSLLSRLDVEQAIRELFEWSYHHRSLIPAYVSFLIERVDAMALGSGGAGGGGGGASILWPYHDICPAFDEIMMEFMRLLNERRDCGTMI